MRNESTHYTRVAVAQLDDGRRMEYDLAHTSQTPPSGWDGYEYLGQGYVYSIDGTVQHHPDTPRVLHFFRRAKPALDLGAEK